MLYLRWLAGFLIIVSVIFSIYFSIKTENPEIFYRTMGSVVFIMIASWLFDFWGK